MESALYKGLVYHERFAPTQHKFSYKIHLFWLKLSEVDELSASLKRFSSSRSAWFRLKRSDYLSDSDKPLEQAVIDKMSELNGTPVSGDVFMLGQLRVWGIYFSPVNFYYLRQPSGKYSHVLAEVSNTPWNERHYYLVDLAVQSDTEKAFHVSPFNPINMTYKWRIAQPAEHLALAMDCCRENKEFTAGLNLRRYSLSNENLSRAMVRIPNMTIKTVVGIYWQALKLFLKRTPLYTHPQKSQEQ